MTFLEQLQESAGLLNNKIKDTDTTQIKSLFGNYNPNLASDYVTTPFGQPIAQNRFLGNEFQMPNLSGQTYTPGAMAPGAGFNFGNMGTFTPGAFNQYGNIPVTGNIPSNVSTTTMRDRGSNESDRRQLERSKGRYSYETFNGKSYRVDNNTGQVEESDLPFGTASLLGGLINQIPGVENYRFENFDEATQRQLFGLLDEETKKKLADAVDTNVTRDYTNQGLISQLTPAEQARLALTDEQRNIVSKKSGYGPFGIGSPSEAERAEALQNQQNQRDLQKQAEKERQLGQKLERENLAAQIERDRRAVNTARPAKVDANKARQLRDRNMGKGTDFSLRSGTGNYGGGYQGGR